MLATASVPQSCRAAPSLSAFVIVNREESVHAAHEQTLRFAHSTAPFECSLTYSRQAAPAPDARRVITAINGLSIKR